MNPGSSSKSREWIGNNLARHYGAEFLEILRSVPIDDSGCPRPGALPPLMVGIELPGWAEAWGVDGEILVPAHLATVSDNSPVSDWSDVDWWAVMVWYADGLAEREHERIHGPIHSYSNRLRGWNSGIWDHAWVNRIALFMRDWGLRLGSGSCSVAPPLPCPEWIMTHDVDALSKRFSLRIKQAAFFTFRSVRLTLRRRFAEAKTAADQAIGFFFGSSDYLETFSTIESEEKRLGLKSCFYVYAMPSPLKKKLPALTRLIDPEYDLADEPEAVNRLLELADAGWEIGLHPSHASWGDADLIISQKECLESLLGKEVTSCRQHWLMFSWEKTWAALAAAGLKTDATLGFNDRPGFRNATAFSIDMRGGDRSSIDVIPMVLMDSHVYAYHEYSPGERLEEINRLADELKLVAGTATTIWHNHTLSDDFGWMEGFQQTVKAASQLSRCGGAE